MSHPPGDGEGEDSSGNGPGAARAPVRIVLADDHAAVRGALRALLDDESDFEVVAQAGDVDGAAREVRAHRPEVLVVALDAPGASSLDTIPQLRGESPDTQIVVLASEQEPAFARQALAAGALGYVLRDAAEEELVEAVRRAAVGESYLDSRLGARIATEPPPGIADELSQRELEVLRLIAVGHTNAEIAAQLFLSVRTVESDRSHLQQKLGLSGRAELVAYALERGLVAR